MSAPELTNGKSLEGRTAESYAAGLPNFCSCTIEVSNYTNAVLTEPNHYLHTGQMQLAPPKEIDAFTKEIFAGEKTTDSLNGSAGVVSYQIDAKLRLFIMYELPHDYIWTKTNWFALALLDEMTPTNEALYTKMYNDSEYDGSNPDRRRDYTSSAATINIKKDGWKITGKMTNDAHAVMKVKIENDNASFRTTPEGFGGGDVVYVYDPPTHVYT